MNRAFVHRLWLLLLVGLSACLHRPPVQTIDSDWTSPLDADLRAAVAAADSEFKQNGWNIRMRWAGVRASAYDLERGPLGEPLRQSAPVVYAVDYPARGKCFLSPEASSATYLVRLAREHVGGGQYGPPRIIGLSPVNGDGEPTGREVVCAAADNARGGVHAQGEAAAASQPEATEDTEAPKDEPVYDPEETLAKLSPTLPRSCREYARSTCTNPDIAPGTDRKAFCEDLVERTNADGQKPKADKRCKAMIKATARP